MWMHRKTCLFPLPSCLFIPVHLPPPPPFCLFSTRLQSSFTNGSSRPAWTPSWMLWRTSPMRPGTSPSPRSSSTLTASPCSHRWWRAELSKSTVHPSLLLLRVCFVAAVCLLPSNNLSSPLCVMDLKGAMQKNKRLEESRFPMFSWGLNAF